MQRGLVSIGPVRAFAALAALAILLALPAPAAPPVAPESLAYQGLLLDGLGEPRTGSVDLVLRIYDAVIGGTLVYKQSFPSVALADGVFTVQLGPTGEASDAPDDPATTSLATALGGDVGPTAPIRFLEVTVGGDGPLTRTQILSSAYALRATSAATADTAATASIANEVVTVGGVDPAYVTQLLTHFSADGSDPPNFDPREGLADVDGDGVPNFLDPDNDGDGISDAVELAEGSDINLVSPRITGTAPDEIFFLDSGPVVVQGTGFEPGLAVAFGSQSPTPIDVTSTAFEVTVGPQVPGLVDVTVTNANGEAHTRTALFRFSSLLPHGVAMAAGRTTLAVTAANAVALGGVGQYGLGPAADALFSFASVNLGNTAVTFDPAGTLAGLHCAFVSSNTCRLQIRIDGDADGDLADETPLAVKDVVGGTPKLLAAALTTDPAGRWVAAHIQRTLGPEAWVAHDRNGDGDFLDANENVLVETTLGNSSATPAALAVDSAGRVAYVYMKSIGPALRVAWDRSGDGDFADTVSGNPELSTLASATACVGATFDAADRLVVVYGEGGTRLARDLNGDGDFADPGEDVVIAPGVPTGCDVAWRPGQPLTVLHNGSAGAVMHLLLDKNDDGDFDDAGEVVNLGVTGGEEAALALNGVDRAVVAVQGALAIGITQ